MDSTTEMGFPCARTQVPIQPTTTQAAAKSLLLLHTGEKPKVAEDSASEHHNMDLDEHEVTGTPSSREPVSESQLDANEQHSKKRVPLPTAARRASETNDDTVMHEGRAIPHKVYDAATILITMKRNGRNKEHAKKPQSESHARSSAPAKRSSKSGSKTNNQEGSNSSRSSQKKRPNLNSSPNTENAHHTLESLHLRKREFPDIEACDDKWAPPLGPRDGKTASWPYLTYSLLSKVNKMTLQEIFAISIEWEPRVVTDGLVKANRSCRHSLTVSQHSRKVFDDQGKETRLWRLANKAEAIKEVKEKNRDNKGESPKSQATSRGRKGNRRRGQQTASLSPGSQSPSSITDNSEEVATETPDTSAISSPPTKIGESFSQEGTQSPPRLVKRAAPNNEAGNTAADEGKIMLLIPGKTWNAINKPNLESAEQGQKRNIAPSELNQAPAAKRPRISEGKSLESSTATSIAEETLVGNPVV
jgi:hypothetical protein